MAKTTIIQVPTVPDRERRWHVLFLGDVLLRHCLVPQPDEEIDDTPPEERLTFDEWRDRHAEYGLNADGSPMDG